MQCWGQTRTNNQDSAYNAYKLAVDIPLGFKEDAQNVAIGDYHTCGYKSDFKLVCWGSITG